MKISIMTLFCEMCERVLSESIIGRARQAGLIDVSCVDIRDFADNKHNRVDDAPYGGGNGMIIQAQPVYDCYQSLCKDGKKPHLIYLSPKGKTFTQKRAVELSKMDNIALLCGHYEGVDQRVLDELVDEEISIGDFVVTGGELPALLVADAVCRLVPGVLSNDECFTDESHFDGLLEYPHYTRPAVWHDKAVPDVLLSGHHENISKWRMQQSVEVTKLKRPDMYEKYVNKD